jgi:peptidyl-prolyl cis-trans isomerase SurA
MIGTSGPARRFIFVELFMGKKVKACFFLFSLLLLRAEAAPAETVDRIVATVNGEIILYSELQEQVRGLDTSSSPQLLDPAKHKEVERQVLQQLIRDRLAQEEAKRLKINISQQEIDNVVKNVEADNHVTEAQLEDSLKREGKGLQDFREKIKKELERNRLMDRALKSKIVITEDQVNAALKSGISTPSATSSPAGPSKEVRKLGIILIPSGPGHKGKEAESAQKLAQDIRGRIQGGESFATMARQYSKGPEAENGGDIGYIGMEELAPSIAAAVRDLKENQMTDVVRTNDGYYIVKVLDIKREQEQVRTNASAGGDRERVRRELAQQELSRKYEEWVRGLESKAFIQISL